MSRTELRPGQLEAFGTFGEPPAGIFTGGDFVTGASEENKSTAPALMPWDRPIHCPQLASHPMRDVLLPVQRGPGSHSALSPIPDFTVERLHELLSNSPAVPDGVVDHLIGDRRDFAPAYVIWVAAD